MLSADLHRRCCAAAGYYGVGLPRRNSLSQAARPTLRSEWLGLSKIEGAGQMHVVVIGGGPAGVSAALQAAELGAEVTLIERGRVGGTALNSGPAPVRTLARAARLVRDWSSWEAFGLRGPRPEVDLTATLANAQRVAGYLHERKHVADHIRSAGVDLIEE